MVMKDASQPADTSRLRLGIFLAAAALVAALTLTVVSLAIPGWVSYHVDASRVFRNDSSSFDYYNRHRGVFLTCMNDTSSQMIKTFASQLKYSTCMDVDLGNLDASNLGFIGWHGAWEIIILRRVHLALHLVSGFCLFVSLTICVASFLTQNAACMQFASCSLSLLAAGFQFGALIVFHSFLMKELMPPRAGTTAAVPASMQATLNLYNALPQSLQLATQVVVGPSYFIALAAFCTCLISGFISMLCGASASCWKPPQAPDSNEAAAAAAASGKYNAGYTVAPSGTSLKANGNEAGRYDSMSNLSMRLPRIPVDQGYMGGRVY